MTNHKSTRDQFAFPNLCLLLVLLWSLRGTCHAGETNASAVIVLEHGTNTVLHWTPELTLVKAVAASGGITMFDRQSLQLIRCGKVTKFTSKELTDQIEQKSAEVKLLPWDIVIKGIIPGIDAKTAGQQ